jgi:tetratricopeptide (TPR) repeat protein
MMALRRYGRAKVWGDRARRQWVRGIRTAAMLLSAVAAAWGAAPPHQATGDVQDWLRLLREHKVGALDDAARQISGWDWPRLQPVLQELRQRAHPAIVLRSAALLSDIAFEIASDKRSLPNVAGETIVADDGRVLGPGSRDGHLAAARWLLDALPRSGSLDAPRVGAHVVAWYRTVSAVLASTHNLADLEPHVARALERFPGDAGILFDAGCFYETFASPLTQIPLAEDAARAAARAPAGMIVEPRPAARMLVEAEKHFRLAMAADPSFVETSVRFGRVLTMRGRTQEAVTVLRRVAGHGTDSIVQYYGWMFYGAALGQAGLADEGLQAFRSAAALYPAAQSPQLAISQLAADSGDPALARAALERVFAPAAGRRLDDPWWNYFSGSGRDDIAARRAFDDRIRALQLPDPDAWRVR